MTDERLLLFVSNCLTIMDNLFYYIIGLTFLRAFSRKLVSRVYNAFTTGTDKESQRLKEEIKTLQEELATISMTDQWAKYAKLQRRINKEKEALKKSRAISTKLKDLIVSAIAHGINLIVAVLIVVAVMYNRSGVVAKLPEQWLSGPIANLLFWSSAVPGGITVPCWVVISSRAATSFANN